MKKLVCGSLLMLIATFINLTPAHAAWSPDDQPITITGTLTDQNGKPVNGKVMVAWCGGILYFGGSDVTDAAGHFTMHTTATDCPMGADLSVVAYNEIDATQVDGIGRATVHSFTRVNVQIGNFDPISVPEYEWVSAVATVALGAGGLVAARRRAYLR